MSETLAPETLDVKTRIRHAYIDAVLTEGKAPASVYVFCKNLGLTEADFYDHYTSFEAIDSDFWTELFFQTRDQVISAEVWAGYSVREKLLSFFFTWIQNLKAHRSFAVYSAKPLLRGAAFDKFGEEYKLWISELIHTGMDSGEVLNRPFLSSRYADGLWVKAAFILNYWVKDSSPQFEQTDAAIEKSVNLAMDLMGHNTLDSFVDFARFLIRK